MSAEFKTDVTSLLAPIRDLHVQIRDAVVRASEAAEKGRSDSLSGIAAEEPGGDTIYAIDKISEELLVEFFQTQIAVHAPIVLIAEGLPGGKVILPYGTPESEAIWRIIVDPIDGTRGIMYQKRSAWILTGVAPNKGPQTNLQDIELAIQTELPLVKQHLSDTLWAVRGKGVKGERFNRITGESETLTVAPTKSPTIGHGYSTVVRFFPGGREVLASIDDEIVIDALGPVQTGKAHCFEDQYACTGGQMYELINGHDRFIADLRALMDTKLKAKGSALGLCCHPYDLCTELIARELGVIVTDPATGDLLKPLLLVDPDVAWVGYANWAIKDQMGPLLHKALASRGIVA